MLGKLRHTHADRIVGVEFHLDHCEEWRKLQSNTDLAPQGIPAIAGGYIARPALNLG